MALLASKPLAESSATLGGGRPSATEQIARREIRQIAHCTGTGKGIAEVISESLLKQQLNFAAKQLARSSL